MKRAPRIAAIQDISGFGRCSTTVVLPVFISRHGRECPAAYRLPLRPHRVSGQREGHLSDLTGQMAGTAAHWAELG